MNYLATIFAMFFLIFVTLSAIDLPDEVEMQAEGNYTPTTVLVPKSLNFQVLFIGGVDMVQTVDGNGNPNGETTAKVDNDFIGFTPDPDSEDLGWVSINHEMIVSNDMIGDGGGMTTFKVRRGGNDELIIVNQTLPDGRQGKFFNIDFLNTVGETGMNCGGVVGPTGRIWSAEEWWQPNNQAIYGGGGGIRDTSDFTIQGCGIEGDFDGRTIKKVENLNYMVEIDPRTAKAIRKQYNWGRQPFEGGCILDDNRTVYLGADATPGLFSKFVADMPGDFTKGKLFVFKQNPGSYAGTWVEIDNSNIDNMLNFTPLSIIQGATMFNRLEWVAFNRTDGKVYLTETGRDNPAGRWSDEAAEGGTYPKHHIDRALEQGVGGPDDKDYWDYYGRVLVFDPVDNTIRPFLEGGPYFEGLDAENPAYTQYPDKHLSNPDGINVFYVNDKTYLLICEDLNGSNYGRVPMGVGNRTCELWLFDMDDEPKVENLCRIAVVPMGAEVTGAYGTPDGKSVIINCQHPWPTNQPPFNSSVTFALTGWDKILTSIEDGDIELEEAKFTVYPNPVSRILNFNMITDAALYNINGKKVKEVISSESMNIEGLASGIYYLKTIDGGFQKIIIE